MSEALISPLDIAVRCHHNILVYGNGLDADHITASVDGKVRRVDLRNGNRLPERDDSAILVCELSPRTEPATLRELAVAFDDDNAPTFILLCADEQPSGELKAICHSVAHVSSFNPAAKRS